MIPGFVLAAKPSGFWPDDPIVDVTATSNSSPSPSPVIPASHGSLNARYAGYQHWCESIGVPSASFEEWERINRQISEGAGSSTKPAPKKKLAFALMRLSKTCRL